MKGNTLRELRKSKGWSQLDLASNADVSIRTISYIETSRGDKSVHPTTERKLMQALGIKWTQGSGLFGEDHRVVVVQFPKAEDLQNLVSGDLGCVVIDAAKGKQRISYVNIGNQ